MTALNKFLIKNYGSLTLPDKFSKNCFNFRIGLSRFTKNNFFK